MAVVAVAPPVASVDRVFAGRIGLHAELHGLLLFSEVLRSETDRAAAILSTNCMIQNSNIILWL